MKKGKKGLEVTKRNKVKKPRLVPANSDQKKKIERNPQRRVRRGWLGLTGKKVGKEEIMAETITSPVETLSQGTSRIFFPKKGVHENVGKRDGAVKKK